MTLSGDLAIDLDAIAANWRALDALTAPEVETAPVVKADAYGCGAARVAPALARAGARSFFVALPGEGAELRQTLGPDPTIYILGGYAPPSQPRATPAATQSPPASTTQSPPPSTTQSPPPSGGRVREGGRNESEGVRTESAGVRTESAGVRTESEGGRIESEGGRIEERTRIAPDPQSDPDSPLYPTHDLRPVLNSAAQAAAWFAAHPEAPCAIQLDTGMNRLGLAAGELASLAPLPATVRLVISHLACADQPGHPRNAAQLAAFARLTEALPGLPRSLAATAGILLGPGNHFDLTRPGIGLYGGWPFSAARPVVSLHLPIIQLHDLAPGASVGYGAAWTAKQPARIATLSSGYADGLIRSLSGGASGWIDGQRLAFAGRVSMDLIGLDVTGCPAAAPGAMVELLGPHQSIDDLAAAAGTIGHEILTSLGSRYRRRYTGA